MKLIVNLLFALIAGAVTASAAVLSVTGNDTLVGNRTNNLIVNGSFEADGGVAANGSYWATGTSLTPTMSLTAWTASGQVASYAIWGSDGFGGIKNSATLVDGTNGVYFGAGIMAVVVPWPTEAANGLVTFTSTPSILPKPTDGPVTLEQTVTGLNPASTYVLDFWTSGENIGQPEFPVDGFFGLEITGEAPLYFAAPSGNGPIGTSQRYQVYFTPSAATITFRWINWGHYYGPSGLADELVLDDVILNQLAGPVPPVDCECLANLPGLITNGCPAYIPDLCALGANCFSTNMLPGSCVQNPPAGWPAGPGTNLISLMVMDLQSNVVFCQVAFVVTPPPEPFLSLVCVSAKTVPCGSEWMFDPPVVNSSCCDPFMTPVVLSDVTNGLCPKQITRTWQVTNSCGLSASCSQTVTVLDTNPPVTLCSGVNLVPNGDFEFHTACPWNGGQIGLAAPWFAATDGTCDHYHSCATTAFVSAPTNAVGQQVPYDGQGYAGIFVYGPDVNVAGSNYREYIEVPLLSPLAAGQTYRLSFYVSRAENYAAAIAEVGAHFSAGPVIVNSYTEVLNVVPQVENSSTNLLLSTTNWMLVQGTFVAAGGESYLTLGNFRADTNTTAVPASGLYTNFCYYYIDHVSLETVCPGSVSNKDVQCGTPWSFDLPAAYDACSGTNVVVSVLSTVTNGACPPVITRTWLLTDACGNTNTWSQSVSLINSNAPTVNCACLEDAALPYLNSTGCPATIPDLSVLSNSPCIPGSCGAVRIGQSPAAGTVVGPGTHPITLTISNCSGGSAICVVPYHVSAPPVFLKCPPNLYLKTCTASAVGWFSPWATGNTGPVVCSPPSGSTFPLGNTVVTCTATNACGGVATCSFTVNVRQVSWRWGCRDYVLGVETLPLGTAQTVYLPDLPGGGVGVDFDNLGSSGQDGVQLGFGPAEKFTFSTVLDFAAPEGATIQLRIPPAPGEAMGRPLLSLVSSCLPPCGWNITRPSSPGDPAGVQYRLVAIGTNGELHASTTFTGSELDTNPVAFIGSMSGATSAVMTVTVDCRTHEVSLDFPQCDWMPDARHKGWDGCIYGNGPRGGTKTNKTARLVLTPLTSLPPSPITNLDLVTSNLTQIAFDNPVITSMGRGWSDRHVILIKAYDDGAERGIEFSPLGDDSPLITDLGYAASFAFKVGHFQNGDVPTQEQLFRVKGWPPGTTTNRPPPPVLDLRLAESSSGMGIDCAADFTQWGVSNVTVQLWSGGILLAEKAHVPAGISSPLVTLNEFPQKIGCPAVGVISLAGTNSTSVLSGLDCPSGVCEGTELRLIAELTPQSLPPVAFTELSCLISPDMDNLIYGLTTVSACTPVPLNAQVSDTGLVLSWDGDGFHLQGAETLGGPWYDLGSTSPAVLPANYGLRVFRLICD